MSSKVITHTCVEKAIEAYAIAYALMEEVQGNPKDLQECLIPKGDQKTGSIGEYWAMRFVQSTLSDVSMPQVTFGHHSQKGWDIEIRIEGEPPRYVQIKTASEFGAGKLGAIRKPDRKTKERNGKSLPDFWNELWIVHLNKKLEPIGFWRIDEDRIDWTIQNRGKAKKGKRSRKKSSILTNKKVPSLLSDDEHKWLLGSDIKDEADYFRAKVGLLPLSH